MTELDKISESVQDLVDDAFMSGYDQGYVDGLSEPIPEAPKDIWVTYKNRDSTSGYRFSCDDKDHPMIAELKGEVAKRNKELRDMFRKNPDSKYAPVKCKYSGKPKQFGVPEHWRLKRVRLMGRGSRGGVREGTRQGVPFSQWSPAMYSSYLPYKFSTHFDVYVGDVS